MWDKILAYFKGSSMENSKGFATFTVVVIIVTLCAIAGSLSVKYLGKDNIIDEELETVAEDAVETDLDLPKGTLKKEADLLFDRSAQKASPSN